MSENENKTTKREYEARIRRGKYALAAYEYAGRRYCLACAEEAMEASRRFTHANMVTVADVSPGERCDRCGARLHEFENDGDGNGKQRMENE